ncbi:hypothetical protein [Tengunoibacter tsumagoiensis]|uniref:Uncharacterized protein n=1 Tax=Tengunoibacter tsumagoiensis TaxID=2014871 RepID=A0A402A230_9CHLR|nr:hypothetical protein [Tengunoibacter tsumagoiensis]GCE13112.1 hypothetical protein KTT_29710 [Tengunoibacter tsumagoiensis]
MKELRIIYIRYLISIHMLIQYLDALDEHALILEQGSSPAIKTGLRQTNLIAVTAQGDVITIFINKKSIGTIHDASYDHGEIGVLVGSDQTAPAEASFQDAKVWD